MNPRIAKEIRVQLLPLSLMMAAAILAPWVGRQLGIALMMPIFGLGCLFVAAAAFGTEYQYRTLSVLLAQPRPRSSLWKEKMVVMVGVLVAATIAVGMVMGKFLLNGIEADFLPVLVPFLLIPICSACSVPFWTMLLRSTLLGAVFGVLVPVFLIMQNAWILQSLRQDQDIQIRSAEFIVLIYSALMLLLGYRRFQKLEAQDGPITSPEAQAPAAVSEFLAKPLRLVLRPFPGMFASLVRKELRLQQFSFIFAAFFCLFIFANMAWHRGRLGLDDKESNSMAVLSTAGFVIYVFIIPLLAGSLALAEEKSWGTGTWHLTLPPGVKMQWYAKKMVALTVSVILGLMLPALLLWLGRAWPERDPQEALWVHLLPVAGFAVVQILLLSVSLYLSSLVGSTVRAMLMSIGLLLVGGCLFHVAVFVGNNLWPEALAIEVISEPLLKMLYFSAWFFVGGCALQFFAFAGFQSQGLSRCRIAGQGVALFAMVVLMGLTAALLGYR